MTDQEKEIQEIAKILYNRACGDDICSECKRMLHCFNYQKAKQLYKAGCRLFLPEKIPFESFIEKKSPEKFKVFVKEIFDLGLEYGDRADWYLGFGVVRLAESDRQTQRFYMDLASKLEYLGSFDVCCVYLREQEQNLFEKFKFYEERHVPFPAPEQLERMWQLRQVRSFLNKIQQEGV